MRLAILDISGILCRLFFACPSLKNDRGEELGATFALVQWFLQFLATEHPAFIVAAMDAPGRKRRHNLYPEYKAQRKPLPDELKLQIQRIRDVIADIGLVQIEEPGEEADDVAASLVEHFHAQAPITLCSGDKDWMQLVKAPRIVQLDPATGKVYDDQAVREKLGVAPSQVVEYLALVGDASDNVPGVPKIGAKTAASILSGGAATAKQLDALANHAAERALSRSLVELRRDIKIGRKLSELVWLQPDDLPETFHKMGFHALAEKVEQDAA